MTTKDYQQKGMFSIFLSFFKPHRGLFFLDMVCALFVALVDLAYPVISRKAINTLLPNLQYKTFFVVMGIVVLAYVIRSLLYYVITYWAIRSASASRPTSGRRSLATCRRLASTFATATAPAI